MRVLIAAGGTAGHINPALAIAGAIKKADPSAEIHFAGRKEGMEYRLVGQAGYPFHHIEITGFQRRLSLNNIKRNIVTLWNLALSGPKAKGHYEGGQTRSCDRLRRLCVRPGGALCLKCPEQVRKNLETLEETWNNYQVYLNDEIDFIDDEPMLDYSLRRKEQ